MHKSVLTFVSWEIRYEVNCVTLLVSFFEGFDTSLIFSLTFSPLSSLLPVLVLIKLVNTTEKLKGLQMFRDGSDLFSFF